jgi:hypothetical protein
VLEAVDQLVRRSDDERLLHTLRTGAPTWLLQFPALVKADQRDALHRGKRSGRHASGWYARSVRCSKRLAPIGLLIVVLERRALGGSATLDVVSTFAATARTRPACSSWRPSVHRVAAAEPASSPARAGSGDHAALRAFALDAFERTEVSEYLALEFDHATFATDLSSAIHGTRAGTRCSSRPSCASSLPTAVIVREGDTWKLTSPVDASSRVCRLAPGHAADPVRSPVGRRTAGAEIASVIGDRLRRVDTRRGCRRTWSASRRSAKASPNGGTSFEAAGIAELPKATMSAFYEFHHSLYRQAIYRRLSEVARIEAASCRGRAAGDICSVASRSRWPPQLAMHFEQAHDYERAVHYLMLTAANAARRFACAIRSTCLQHAMRLVPRLPPERRTALEVEILERIGDAHYALGADGRVGARLRDGVGAGWRRWPHRRAGSRADLFRAPAGLAPTRSGDHCTAGGGEASVALGDP